jgi:hypothetical protein
MSFFSVAPDELVAGSSVIGRGGAGQASAGLGSMAGAAGSTPVAGAWDSFVDRAGAASIALDEAVAELANALATAGRAYARSDSTAATGLGPER